MKIRVNDINFNRIKENPIVKQVINGINEITTEGYICKPNYDIEEEILDLFYQLKKEVNYPTYNVFANGKEIKLFSIVNNHIVGRYFDINENQVIKRKTKNRDRILLKDVVDLKQLEKDIKKDFNEFIEKIEKRIENEIVEYIKNKYSDKINWDIIEILKLQKEYNKSENKIQFLKKHNFKNVELFGYREEKNKGRYTEGITYKIDWNKKEIILDRFSTDD